MLLLEINIKLAMVYMVYKNSVPMKASTLYIFHIQHYRNLHNISLKLPFIQLIFTFL